MKYPRFSRTPRMRQSLRQYGSLVLGVGGQLVDSARSRLLRPGGVPRRSGADGRSQVKDDPMAGAWIVEMVIAALVLMLIAKVAGMPFTGYSAVIPLVVGGLIVTALHARGK
jgi:hypothetical protein